MATIGRGPGGVEQFPLLKVESGDGDASPPVARDQLQSRVVTPKRKCCCWWPELVLVCWITLVLFVVGLIAFMAASSTLNEDNLRRSRQLECLSNNNPHVYFYQIIYGGNMIRFKHYAEYLNMIASMYPNLCFNVNFLEDDSTRSFLGGARQNRIFNTLFHNNAPSWTTKLGIADLHALNAILKKHNNFNVTVSPLSSYMEKTKLKNKWRSASMTYLAFYLGANSVWQNGGIALDLATYSNKYYFQHYDARIANVFKQLNDDVSCKIQYDEEKTLRGMLVGMLYQFWNKWSTAPNYNRSHVYPDSGKARDPDEPVIRTQRNKREYPTVELDVVNVINIDTSSDLYLNETETFEENKTVPILPTKSSNTSTINLLNGTELNMTNATKPAPKWLYVYDFTVFSRPFFPVVDFEDQRLYETEQVLITDGTLTMNNEGTFIASACPQHPFLEQILASDCSRNSNFCIQNVYIQKCSGILEVKRSYCETIRFI